ncbi:MAG: hypothetical protein HQ553_03555 [Chloroflexi bacterium]|nr:hypothetical protein [Chloroflexota bacterium]
MRDGSTSTAMRAIHYRIFGQIARFLLRSDDLEREQLISRDPAAASHEFLLFLSRRRASSLDSLLKDDVDRITITALMQQFHDIEKEIRNRLEGNLPQPLSLIWARPHYSSRKNRGQPEEQVEIFKYLQEHAADFKAFDKLATRLAHCLIYSEESERHIVLSQYSEVILSYEFLLWLVDFRDRTIDTALDSDLTWQEIATKMLQFYNFECQIHQLLKDQPPLPLHMVYSTPSSLSNSMEYDAAFS